jgi:hypothetical protein
MQGFPSGMHNPGGLFDIPGATAAGPAERALSRLDILRAVTRQANQVKPGRQPFRQGRRHNPVGSEIAKEVDASPGRQILEPIQRLEDQGIL